MSSITPISVEALIDYEIENGKDDRRTIRREENDSGGRVIPLVPGEPRGAPKRKEEEEIFDRGRSFSVYRRVAGRIFL